MYFGEVVVENRWQVAGGREEEDKPSYGTPVFDW